MTTCGRRFLSSQQDMIASVGWFMQSSPAGEGKHNVNGTVTICDGQSQIFLGIHGLEEIEYIDNLIAELEAVKTAYARIKVTGD